MICTYYDIGGIYEFKDVLSKKCVNNNLNIYLLDMSFVSVRVQGIWVIVIILQHYSRTELG